MGQLQSPSGSCSNHMRSTQEALSTLSSAHWRRPLKIQRKNSGRRPYRICGGRQPTGSRTDHRVARSRCNHGVGHMGAKVRTGAKLLDGLQKSLPPGSFCQNLRKDCNFNFLQSRVAYSLSPGITHRGEWYRGSTRRVLLALACSLSNSRSLT